MLNLRTKEFESAFFANFTPVEGCDLHGMKRKGNPTLDFPNKTHRNPRATEPARGSSSS